MPGSTVTTLPASRSLRDSCARRGSSWTTRPMPCPRPWPNASPKPAASIRSRAAESTPGPDAPGRTASSPASWASRQTSYARFSSSGKASGREGPRAVGAVAVDDAARVDEHRLAGLDRGDRRARCAAWPRSGLTRRWSRGTTRPPRSPRAGTARSARRARARCGRRRRPRPRTARTRCSRSRPPARIASSSSSSLTARSSSTRP